MLDHFREIFDALLSAYRRHYSCQTVLLKLTEDVKSALDGGHKVGTILMDLSKAFDCRPPPPPRPPHCNITCLWLFHVSM